ncbi:hypothetical protein CMV_023935 [Castanea mollissima]|uniref:Uncharacterized protein n=1 Tax=Castanea mollissima TaxID=60419 RepID=A0A8J4QFN9_9ROSI|nr:hypothetical protein CMV_023935 [Castanea mollissima]
MSPSYTRRALQLRPNTANSNPKAQGPMSRFELAINIGFEQQTKLNWFTSRCSSSSFRSILLPCKLSF